MKASEHKDYLSKLKTSYIMKDNKSHGMAQTETENEGESEEEDEA
jgi:hypothetical protein